MACIDGALTSMGFFLLSCCIRFVHVIIISGWVPVQCKTNEQNKWLMEKFARGCIRRNIGWQLRLPSVGDSMFCWVESIVGPLYRWSVLRVCERVPLYAWSCLPLGVTVSLLDHQHVPRGFPFACNSVISQVMGCGAVLSWRFGVSFAEDLGTGNVWSWVENETHPFPQSLALVLESPPL